MRQLSSTFRLTTLFIVLALALAACGTPATTSAPETSPDTAASGTTAVTSPTEATTSQTVGAAATTAASGNVSSAANQGSCTPEAATSERPDPPLLVIGTGNTGGVFFPYGGGIARVLTAKLAGAQVTAEETGGSVDNMKLIHAGDADLGLSTVDSAYDAIQGQGPYADTGPIAACTLAVLYPSFLHIVARADSGITTVADMKGKTVSVGSAGSSTESAADRVLEAAGLDPRSDINRQSLSVADGAAAIKDQKIDAFFWVGGLPTSAVTDLVTTPNVNVTFVPAAEHIDAMTEKYGPVYTPFALPPGTYPGLDQEVPGIGINNILFAGASMNESLAYDIVKTLFDNLADVQASHPEAKKLALETAAKNSSLPFHPGAIRFFQEKGVWTP